MPDQIKIICQKSGLYTSIQDEGRFGVQDQGIPFSGALDKTSMHIANKLVGNPIDTPVLEMTMFGPSLLFEGSGQVSITGADMKAELNGEAVEIYTTINIESGDLLTFHDTNFGCRAYLGIGGQWQTQKWLNSFSAVPSLLKAKGLNSRVEDGFEFVVDTHDAVSITSYPLQQRPIYSECYIVRVVTGPEFDQFDIGVIQDFFNKVFMVDADSNRMGYRLKGSLENYTPRGEEISSGVATGTIQISNAGSPIILMADAQTTGGYPRICNVVLDDLDIVAQMKPGDELKFMLVSLEDL